MIVCLKPRALHAVTNATMEAHSCFCLSAYGGNPSHPLCGWALTPQFAVANDITGGVEGSDENWSCVNRSTVCIRNGREGELTLLLCFPILSYVRFAEMSYRNELAGSDFIVRKWRE